MSLLEPERPQPYVEPKEKASLRYLGLGIAISVILFICGIVQTEMFVSFLPSPDIKTIREHMAHCRRMQGEMAPQNRQHGIVFQLFNDEPRKNLEATRDALLNDESLQSDLKEKFGASFRDLDVVVVPAWVIDTANNDLIGITHDGWEEAKKVKGYSNVGGITIRDKPQLTRRTLDGRARILLNPRAFQNLRLTLFHELLHAMNVPAHYPSPVTFAQTDLTYLSEYREIVRREQMDKWHEIKIWALAVGVPALLLVLIVRRFVKLRRRLRQYAHGAGLAAAAGSVPD